MSDLTRRPPDPASRWRVLAEAATEAVIVVERGRIVDCNEAACRLFGRERSTLVGQPVPGVLVHEAWQEEVARRVRERLAGVFEGEIVRADGAAVPVEAHVRELVVGGVALRAVTLRDMTLRKAHEEELREVGERLRALLETTFDGVLVSRGGLVLEANEGFARMCGYELQETIGMVPSAVTTPESAAVVGEMIRNRVHAPYVVTGVRKDGSTFPMEIQGQECVYRGERVRITGFRDLSATRRAEAERRALEERVYQAQRIESLGMLAGGVAHDFNNLLVGVLGNAEIARRQLRQGKDPEAALERISVAAKRAAELTRQLLLYAGREEPAPGAVDLQRVTRETADLILSSIQPACELAIDFPDEPLPPVLADRAQLGQVVLNLLTNAVEAMEGRPGRIRVSARPLEVTEAGSTTLPGPPALPGRYVCLSVTDEGAGMSQANVGRVFEPFYSSHGTGRGLGLATVLGIVRSHGGGITMDSHLGRGTTVAVSFRASLDAGQAASDADAPPMELERPLRMLVVDDDPLVMQVTHELLDARGHAVLMASSGEEGLRLWEEHRREIDVVVLDVYMPRLDGVGLYGHLLAADPAVRVLFCSGFQPSSDVHRLVQLGAVEFLAKPYLASDLERAIARLLASHPLG